MQESGLQRVHIPRISQGTERRQAQMSGFVARGLLARASTKLGSEGGRIFQSGKAPARYEQPTKAVATENAACVTPSVHRVQPLAKASGGHSHVHEVRKLPLVRCCGDLSVVPRHYAIRRLT